MVGGSEDSERDRGRPAVGLRGKGPYRPRRVAGVRAPVPRRSKSGGLIVRSCVFGRRSGPPVGVHNPATPDSVARRAPEGPSSVAPSSVWHHPWTPWHRRATRSVGRTRRDVGVPRRSRSLGNPGGTPRARHHRLRALELSLRPPWGGDPAVRRRRPSGHRPGWDPKDGAGLDRREVGPKEEWSGGMGPTWQSGTRSGVGERSGEFDGNLLTPRRSTVPCPVRASLRGCGRAVATPTANRPPVRQAGLGRHHAFRRLSEMPVRSKRHRETPSGSIFGSPPAAASRFVQGRVRVASRPSRASESPERVARVRVHPSPSLRPPLREPIPP